MAKTQLTPEQQERLVQTMMKDADRRANPDPRQSLPVSDEDMRSFPASTK
jgi:hypothetical protein